MEKVQVVYWSGTGNTEAMAKAIADGVQESGTAAELVSVDAANKEELLSQKGFALGCPSMGAEELEESEMEPFISEIESRVSGKEIVLFGSYGWGDGEWMRSWTRRMEKAGAVIVGGKGIIANEAPDGDAIEQCKMAGKKLASL